MVIPVASYFAIYFVLWWIVLFAVLPFGVKSQSESGGGVAGSDPGAPMFHRMARKLIWTTVASTILFALGVWGFRVGLFNIERASRLMGFPF